MQIEFERFPFPTSAASAGDDAAADRHKQFVAAKRVEHLIEISEEDLAPPPPTFSEEQLEQAKQQAYQEGFQAGEQKGKAWADSEIAKIEQAALELSPKIIETMSTVFTHYNQFVTEQKKSTNSLALELAKKMAGELSDDHHFEQLASRCIECLEQMLGEPELHVYVHPSVSDRMENRLANHFAASKEPGDVIIHRDEQVSLQDCRIEWQSGGMLYQHGAVQQKLSEIIDGLNHSVETQPPAIEAQEEQTDEGDDTDDANDAQVGQASPPTNPEQPTNTNQPRSES